MNKIYLIITIGMMFLLVGGVVAGVLDGTITLPKNIKTALASIGITIYDKTDVQIGDAYTRRLKQEECWEEVFPNEWDNDTITLEFCRNILDTTLVSDDPNDLIQMEED